MVLPLARLRLMASQPRNAKLVYLITYSKADMALLPTRGSLLGLKC